MKRVPARSIPFWILLFCYWGILFYFTHLKGLVVTMRGGDKMAHYLAYGLLGGLLYLALWTNNPMTRDIVFKILVIGMCYGALDEWTQALPWFQRTCDFVDWCADCAGLATAVVGMTVIRRGFDLVFGGRSR
jgi:VanZ family protein